MGIEKLVGTWNTEVSNASFLPDRSARLSGHATGEWLGGAFVILRQGAENLSSTTDPAPPSAIWIIGRDASNGTYGALYHDDRGVDRIYQVSFAEGIWRMWRNAPEFSQRFTGTFEDGGDTIRGAWEISTDGRMWEHDFDLTYRRRER